MGGKEGDPHHHHPPPSPPQYGTFHPPAMGFPQPAPPPGALPPPSAPPLHGSSGGSAPPNPYYAPGYQAVPGYAAVVAEGRPVRERRLPCCGIGMGWFLFIIGFFLAAIPWYVGAIIMLCSRVDYREKPGFIACTIAAVIAAIAVIIGATKEADAW